MCKDQLRMCEACKVFEPVFEYQSPMHKKIYISQIELLLLLLLSKLFGGEVGGFGGGSFPRAPPPSIDETLSMVLSKSHIVSQCYPLFSSKVFSDPTAIIRAKLIIHVTIMQTEPISCLGLASYPVSN